MKKIVIAIVLLLTGSCFVIPCEAKIHKGKTKEGVTYQYNTKSKTLTMSGKIIKGNLRNPQKVQWDKWSGKAKKIVLKEGVETVEDGAFNEFVKVNKIVFPKKLKKIGVSAFGDTGIRQRILPDSVTEIGWIAFVKNTIYGGIEKIRLPKKLCRIDSGAFSGHNFTSITIPKNVTFIGSRVFEDCSELKTIIIKSKKIKKLEVMHFPI